MNQLMGNPNLLLRAHIDGAPNSTKLISLLASFFVWSMPSVSFAVEFTAGVLQGTGRACAQTFIVVTDDTITLDNCKSAKFTTKPIGDALELSFDVAEQPSCPRMLRIRNSSYSSGLQIAGYRVGQSLEWECGFDYVDPDLANDQVPRYLKGETGEIRADALEKINKQFHIARFDHNRSGLRDSHPDVRIVALTHVDLDMDWKAVPLVIDLFLSDKSEDVRQAAWGKLRWYFKEQGPPESCGSVKQLERKWDQILKRLVQPEYSESFVNFLNNEYPEGSSILCCMSNTNRKKGIEALSIYSGTQNAVAKAENCEATLPDSK